MGYTPVYEKSHKLWGRVFIMSDKKESSKFIPVTIVLLLVIAALYFLFDTMKEVPPQPVSSQPAVAEQSVDAIPSEETPEEAEEAKAPTPGDLVVKTKTLSILMRPARLP